MSNLFTREMEDNSILLTYTYKNINDIDDIILQLLNESGVDGFVKSRINKKNSSISYNVTGLVSAENLKDISADKKAVVKILENLNELIIYLEDSFVDIEYVCFDDSEIFFDELNRKIYIIVLPCYSSSNAEHTLDSFVKKFLLKFDYNDSDNVVIRKHLEEWNKQKIDSYNFTEFILGLDQKETEEKVQEETIFIEPLNVSEMTEEEVNETEEVFEEKELPVEEFPIEEIPVEEVPVEEVSVEELPVEEVSEEKPQEKEIVPEANRSRDIDEIFKNINVDDLFDDIPEDILAEETIIIPDVEYMDKEPDALVDIDDILIADPITEVEEKIIEEIVIDFSEKVEEEIPEAVEVEKSEAVEEEIQEAVEEETPEVVELETAETFEEDITETSEALEVPEAEEVEAEEENLLIDVSETEEKISEQTIEDIRNEVIDNLRKEIREELEKEIRQEIELERAALEAEQQKPAYLIRKSTGQVIPLDKETFIIGSKSSFCDYTINNNDYISNVHGIIRYNEAEQKYYLIDCNSMNGVYVNSNRMLKNQRAELKDQMIIFFATEIFIFRM